MAQLINTKQLSPIKPREESGERSQSFGKFLWQVVGPMGLGVLIYLGFRDTEVLIFREWLPFLEATPIWEAPDWFAYNLPDGLWLYASLQLLGIIWGRPFPRPSYPWVVGLLLLAFGSELLQALHLIPGTGDWGDVVAYGVGGICFFIT